MDNDALAQLGKLFSGYRAEWLKERVFELFKEPSYFPELTTPNPCILLGGRGTGKTTALKWMSYEGQFARAKEHPESIDSWEYFGFYLRVNTNRVTAFKGAELNEEQWIRVFGHYINLVFSELVARFLLWYRDKRPDHLMPSAQEFGIISTSLRIDAASSIDEFQSAILDEKSRLEAYINNLSSLESLNLSLQSAPVDLLMEIIGRLPQFSGKQFFFLVDEYENLLDYQQKIINTFIKHASEWYTFKIGVKELGMRCRTTLNPHEQLISPSDYIRIQISEKLEGPRFIKFALSVCNSRLAEINLNKGDAPTIETLFPELSPEDEAVLLAKDTNYADEVNSAIKVILPSLISAELDDASLLKKIFFLNRIAAGKEQNPADYWVRLLNDDVSAQIDYNNYKHSILFSIKKGKPGIRKYYTGYQTLAQMAGYNIRFFMELVDQVLRAHLLEGENTLRQPVSAKIQTLAAQSVGRKNLSELEGLDVNGAKLTKLVLGLGRIFQVMAADATGHAPEVNHFYLGQTRPSQSARVEKLLLSAVDHLALIRYPGNKLSSPEDTMEYDYRLHPIFSAYFAFSHRKKRKILLDSSDLEGIIESPKQSIKRILAKTGRSDAELVPDQLLLFAPYYEAEN